MQVLLLRVLCDAVRVLCAGVAPAGGGFEKQAANPEQWLYSFFSVGSFFSRVRASARTSE